MMNSTKCLGDLGRQCKNCAFFANDGFERYGTCHRYAPKPVVYDLKDAGEMCIHQPAIWPAVEPHEFCGEFVADTPIPTTND